MVVVAPPRGERGLKHLKHSPDYQLPKVAPPRGERGLKHTKLLRALWQL